MLLASSEARGWLGLSAELRSHGKGVVTWAGDQRDTEICVCTSGSESVVSRRNGHVSDQTVAVRGATWLSPARSRGGVIDISDSIPEILHVRLQYRHFSPQGLGIHVDQSIITALRYKTGVHDALLAEMTYAIASELLNETSTGKMLVETLAIALAARLIQSVSARPQECALSGAASERLDDPRLSRVLAYIEENLEADLTLDRLAAVACLSRFHFARAIHTGDTRAPCHVTSLEAPQNGDLLAAKTRSGQAHYARGEARSVNRRSNSAGRMTADIYRCPGQGADLNRTLVNDGAALL